MTRALPILLATALAAPVALAADPATITGTAHFLDADTVRVSRHVTVRLFGIDAPEKEQSCTREGASYRCGDAATAFARRLAEGRRIVCESRDADRYKRVVAECWAIGPAGERVLPSLNEAIVRAGWAIAFRRYSTEFVEAEAAAREAHVGLWAGEFQQPTDHRAERREKTSPR